MEKPRFSGYIIALFATLLLAGMASAGSSTGSNAPALTGANETVELVARLDNKTNETRPW